MTKFDPLGLDYHILSVQQLASKCLVQPDLRDELYCQILRQISGTPITSAINTLQVSFFVSVCYIQCTYMVQCACTWCDVLMGVANTAFFKDVKNVDSFSCVILKDLHREGVLSLLDVVLKGM